ncbi:MAG: hypothetical protein JO197_08080 [Acidobacteria bacterium]|nr:hypothetical protein [Acidobacteriota bacterium]MBV9475941.1 hypothetical protein [Acidobacteriota bacterium]
MKRTLVLVLAMWMIAAVASANGGGHGGPPPSGFDDRGGDHGGGPGGEPLIVGTDGTVYITRGITDSATNTTTTTVSAITPAGATAWTVTLPSGRGPLLLSGSNLLTVRETEASDGSETSTITAIATSNGATAWTLNLNGDVTGLRPFSGGTYATVVVPPATSTASPTRSLVAISNSGTILWTVTL